MKLIEEIQELIEEYKKGKIKRVVRNGKTTTKTECPSGYKVVERGRCEKMSRTEEKRRKRAAKKSKRTRKSSSSRESRKKRQKSMRVRNRKLRNKKKYVK